MESRKDRRFELRISGELLDSFTGVVGRGRRSAVVEALIRGYVARKLKERGIDYE